MGRDLQSVFPERPRQLLLQHVLRSRAYRLVRVDELINLPLLVAVKIQSS